MQYAVLRNHNRHIVLRITQTPKITQYLESQATGIVQSKMPSVDFNKEYDKEVPLTITAAAVSFLTIAKRAYVFNQPVIQILKEIIMTTATTKEEKAIAEATTEAPTPAQEEVIAKKAEKAAKVKATKPPKESKPRGLGIGAFCNELIIAGKTNTEILDAVKAKWPEAKTTVASLAWYRNDLKKVGV